MADTIALEIVTPDGLKLKEAVNELTAPTLRSFQAIAAPDLGLTLAYEPGGSSDEAACLSELSARRDRDARSAAAFEPRMKQAREFEHAGRVGAHDLFVFVYRVFDRRLADVQADVIDKDVESIPIAGQRGEECLASCGSAEVRDHFSCGEGSLRRVDRGADYSCAKAREFFNNRAANAA